MLVDLRGNGRAMQHTGKECPPLFTHEGHAAKGRAMLYRATQALCFAVEGQWQEISGYGPCDPISQQRWKLQSLNCGG